MRKTAVSLPPAERNPSHGLNRATSADSDGEREEMFQIMHGKKVGCFPTFYAAKHVGSKFKCTFPPVDPPRAAAQRRHKLASEFAKHKPGVTYTLDGPLYFYTEQSEKFAETRKKYSKLFKEESKKRHLKRLEAEAKAREEAKRKAEEDKHSDAGSESSWAGLRRRSSMASPDQPTPEHDKGSKASLPRLRRQSRAGSPVVEQQERVEVPLNNDMETIKALHQHDAYYKQHAHYDYKRFEHDGKARHERLGSPLLQVVLGSEYSRYKYDGHSRFPSLRSMMVRSSLN